MGKTTTIKITGVILIVLAFMLVGWFLQKSDLKDTNVGGDSLLTTKTTFFDFGEISMAKGKVSTAFEISNPTDDNIKINKISTSCACTVAYFINKNLKKGPFGMPGHGGLVEQKINEIIKPGENRIIEVVFDPAAHGPAGIGVIDRSTYVTDSQGRVLQLETKANVIP